jgi:two-component system response regulator PilR (NtrC family)
MAIDKIIVVDDEESMRDFLSIMLTKEGYEVFAFATPEKCLKYFKTDPVGLVITDLRMPGMGGVGLLKELKALSPDVVVIVITAYASVETAIEAMRFGAYDYFTKPFNIDDIKMHIKRALEWRHLERENSLLKKDIKSRTGFNDLVGSSPLMAEIYELILSVAATKANVLISGESGTGKELVARAIHNESPRKDGPFVTVNCGAIPENLLESELFGHMKGAFTGAIASKKGLAELADGGTLFLDEITELPLPLQVKLLRFIQDRSFRRVGGTTDITVDMRLLAASNRDVEALVRDGGFREDLFYRLNVIRVSTPLLRDRAEDIPQLVKHFVEKYSKDLSKVINGVSEDALALLVDYSFPGNVRELENAIERAVAVEKTDMIVAESLPPMIRDFTASTLDAASIEDEPDLSSGKIDLEKLVSEYERTIIMKALEKTGGVRKRAAELLGISFRSIRYKLEKYEDNDR